MFGLRSLIFAGLLVAGWFVYGWGSEIINNYSTMQSDITTLERDKRLIESRVKSLRTLLARRDAAIKASRCSKKIEAWVKNPDTIPTPFDPFNQGPLK